MVVDARVENRERTAEEAWLHLWVAISLNQVSPDVKSAKTNPILSDPKETPDKKQPKDGVGISRHQNGKLDVPRYWVLGRRHNEFCSGL